MDSDAPSRPGPTPPDHQVELHKEAFTMALYVAICLLAALSILGDREVTEPGTVARVIWGTTVGLAVAHWFAFRMASRLVASGGLRQSDAEAAVAQIGGAAVVAVLASIPLAVLRGPTELDAARLVLAVFIALVGGVVARSGGASTLRSAIAGGATLVVAVGIALLKNILAGH